MPCFVRNGTNAVLVQIPIHLALYHGKPKLVFSRQEQHAALEQPRNLGNEFMENIVFNQVTNLTSKGDQQDDKEKFHVLLLQVLPRRFSRMRRKF